MASTFINHMTFSILQENRDLEQFMKLSVKIVHYECQKIKTKKMQKYH